MIKRLLLAASTLGLVLSAAAFCPALSFAEGAAETKLTETEKEEEVFLKYEAVFLESDEVNAIFDEVRDGEPPYEIVDKEDFHVTIVYMPETPSDELYGKEVKIKLVGYKAGEVKDDEGKPTYNEGFKAELYSEDPDMQKFLDTNEKNYHITGSFSDAAKYTGLLDFSDAEPVEYEITGVFGGRLSNHTNVYSAGELKEALE